MDVLLLIPVTGLLVAANLIASLIALSNREFMARNLFHVGPILSGNEWHRLVTSAFLHRGVLHLLVNMFVLFTFGGFVERSLGTMSYLIVYFAALLGANGWALMENKTNPNYRALGASGATSGIVMCFILLRPFEQLVIFPIPFPMPAVLIGILFLVGSAILSQRTSRAIAHEAHLGGALSGIVATVLVAPSAFSGFANELSRALGGS